MATRSRIGMEYTNKQGKKMVKSIYCHFDGYPEGVGQFLINHYDREKTEDLIKLGDISFIRPSIKKPKGHSFETPVEGYTVAYHRDRGEAKTPARLDMGVAEFFRSDFEQFGYVLTEEGEWLVSGGDEPVPLSYVLSGVEMI